MPILPPRRIAHAQELLDVETTDSKELNASLRHVAQVNRFFGGEHSLLQRIRPHYADGLRVLDIGTGNGAIPCRIAADAVRHEVDIEITAIDSNAAMLDIARATTRAYPCITLQQADALALPFADGSFDIACMTLTLHHFEGAAAVRALCEMRRVARIVLVSDLERCWPNYLGARLLALTWWRRNRITRHDGPLSVLRAFTSHELMDLARDAGLKARVHRHFFHRLVLEATGGAA